MEIGTTLLLLLLLTLLAFAIVVVRLVLFHRKLRELEETVARVPVNAAEQAKK